jgi:hypothetical protein
MNSAYFLTFLGCRHWHGHQGNFDHGAYKSGDKLEAKRDAFQQYLVGQDESYFESFQESVASDRGDVYTAYGDHEQVADTMYDWLNSTALRNRGMYATWNNINNIFLNPYISMFLFKESIQLPQLIHGNMSMLSNVQTIDIYGLGSFRNQSPAMS